METIKTKTLIDLLAEVEALAIQHHDGHLTIMRFTTGWKVCLDTPDLHDGYDQVLNLKSFGSLEAALTDLLKRKESSNG